MPKSNKARRRSTPRISANRARHHVDVGSTMGIGCPPHTGGPAQFIDRLTAPDH
jgi:hypothetical protein